MSCPPRASPLCRTARALLAWLTCATFATSQVPSDVPRPDAPATGDRDGAAAAPTTAPTTATPTAPAAATTADSQTPPTGGWRLLQSHSPYLREHADNPVEWYPWGPEAFERAKELDRPIFLSIGYLACHWCHRMERDTFENAECARLLNENFISIKVDREERPDIDNRYMQALAAITGSGGWPASLFLTPDGQAFAGGTYIPPDDATERPGFKWLANRVSTLWKEQRESVLDAGRELSDALLKDPLPPPPDPAAALAQPAATSEAGSEAEAAAAPRGNLHALLDNAVLELAGGLDSERGGAFGAPKFPPAMTLSFLLRQHVRSGVAVVPLVRASLDAMAGGALQDHVGGGFHRYCVDENWELPHFEKMLADNALLAMTYAEAFAVTGEQEYADVARRTLGFVWRDLSASLTGNPMSGTSLDADSVPFDENGVAQIGARADEGRVYLWTLPELKAALGEEDAARFAPLYHVTLEGTVEAGRSLPRPMTTRRTLLAKIGADADSSLWLDGCLSRLAAARAKRPQPARDDKCVATLNGLLLSAYARAGALLQDRTLRDRALGLAVLLKAHLMSDGPAALRHQYFEGSASGEADLLDHACVARGLLDAGSALGTSDLIADAFALTRVLLERFEDREGGGFFDTTGSDPYLPGRTRDLWDSALPAGTSVAIEVLLRLAPLDDSGRFAAAAQRALARVAPLVERTPQGFPALLSAIDMARGPLAEIVMDGTGPDFEEMLAEVGRTLLPAALVVPHTVLTTSMLAREGVAEPELLKGRRAPPNEARAWVCENGTCLAPARNVAELHKQLQQIRTRR